ncbi:class III lanthionine synthetase LanKC [Streptomyces sp. CB03238]|uniref:class III lanthionine synthetase LanKC n=1 Tax=Streptomyces sp. CB03238 TaxID=1907777 RepID=UPI001F4E83C2|nr:class III lanthionine synthetase LanKC [Streptomyces sp. CB03238]
MRYEAFCLTDSLFYDTPARAGDTAADSDGDGDFEQTRCPVPDTWVREDLDDWVVLHPDGAELPPQGWKVHVSACLDNAEEILGAVWDYCIARRISFKFRPGLDALLNANIKYAPRGASGKFVTIYPADEARLKDVLTDLDGVLHGRPGPYILSDLRWASGPLYVRYGGFVRRYCVSPDTGETVLAVEDASGRLVPDLRKPVFEVPEWVTLPGFLEPHLAARAGTTVADLPYRIEKALHFSNGGGLYAGRDTRTDERVVLKEARPYAGLTEDGADAVSRLHRERETLERLAGLDCVPALRDHFVLGEHHFLVEEFIEGQPLTDLFRERYPLTSSEPDDPEPDDTAAVAYTSWAVDLAGRVERAVTAVHDRGLVIGDVHPSNILVRPDGRVVLIDFEVAADPAEGRPQTLAAPGFQAPDELTGFDIDRYALSCLRLHMFMPLTQLIDLDQAKAAQLAREARQSFPVPRAFLDEAVWFITGSDSRTPADGTEPRLDADHDGWLRARDSLAAAILAAATPDRDDRLFPGDIEQFGAPGGGLGVAYGAAGVLYALDVTGAGRHPGHEEWLVRRALSPEPGARIGFYDGLHGVAHVLDRLGHRDEALKVLDMSADDDQWEALGLDLHGGLAGIGLNLQHFAAVTGEPVIHDAAMSVAQLVADRLGPADGIPETSGGQNPHAGLMRGSSGPALLFLRLYEHTGDPAFLDVAATALRRDLRRCVVRRSGGMQVNEGWRTVPYLAEGSVGIGLVLDDYLAHRQDEQFTAAAAEIRRAASAQFSSQPGIFSGTAGMILHLSRAYPVGTAAERDPVVAGHVRRLSRQALTYQGHLAFPGEALMRLSMDLATGSAGVLLALGAALHHAPVQLPFLRSPSADGERHTAEPSDLARKGGDMT